MKLNTALNENLSYTYKHKFMQLVEKEAG